MANKRITPMVGERISFVCVEDDGSFQNSCAKCIFSPCYRCDDKWFPCSPYSRLDGCSVHYERVEIEDKNL